MFFKILIKILKIPHRVMDMRPTGEGRLIDFLRTEVGILDSATELGYF